MSDDSLRALLDSVFRSPAYRWAEDPAGAAWLERWWNAIAAWLWALRLDHPMAFRVLLVVMAVVLLAILAHTAWIVTRTVRAAAGADDRQRPASAAPRNARWYHGEAERLARAGRWAEALGAAFSGLVLDLDARGALRRRAGATPAEYAREARLAPAARSRFASLVSDLYRFAYGGAPCGPDEYHTWRSRAAEDWDAASG